MVRQSPLAVLTSMPIQQFPAAGPRLSSHPTASIQASSGEV